MNESRYRELKEKMAALKSLYASRHYSQCAKLGELLLGEMHDQVGAAGRTCSIQVPRKEQQTTNEY